MLMVRVVKCDVNMGALPYFDGEKANRLRIVAFHQDRLTEKFPCLHSLTQIEDVEKATIRSQQEKCNE